MEAKPPEKQHLLTLKVMRLTRPTFYKSDTVSVDARDVNADVSPFVRAARDDITLDEGAPSSSFSRALLLPQTFGNIYLGETFSSYITVHNGSGYTCSDVSFKADLQSSNVQTAIPTSHEQPTAVMEPGESIDDIIQQELKEMGTHMLVCSVNYTSPSGERLHFRKFFRFQVLKPLEVKTKFLNAEDYASDEVYLETQIQNVTSTVIFLEQVTLEPTSHFDCDDLNELVLRNAFNKYINPLDSFQFLFRLTPKKGVKGNQKLLKTVTSMGRLDIAWKTNMGEAGRLQTSTLQRVVPGYGDIRLYVKALQAEAQLESAVDVSFTLTNCSERTINPCIEMRNAERNSVIWTGISGRQLGDLEPNQGVDFHLVFVPVVVGLVTLSGIRVIDTFLQRLYEYDELAQVFVKAEEDKDCQVEHIV